MADSDRDFPTLFWGSLIGWSKRIGWAARRRRLVGIDRVGAVGLWNSGKWVYVEMSSGSGEGGTRGAAWSTLDR